MNSDLILILILIPHAFVVIFFPFSLLFLFLLDLVYTGAMMARGDAASTFGPGDHASTYGGNPLACAAGLAVAKYICDNNILDNVEARGQQLKAGLEKLSKKYPTVLGDVRGWGLLRGVECIADDITAGELVAAAMKEGLLLVPAGTNVVRFVPPLIITEDELNIALDRLDAAVKSKAN